MKGLAVDVVILNERAMSYIQDLQNALETQVRVSQSPPQPGAHRVRGSVFVLRADLISEQTRALLLAVARVVLVARRGDLADQLDRVRKPAVSVLKPTRRVAKTEPPRPLRRRMISNSSTAWAGSARKVENT
jgi:cyclic beta-1,2-glucan synthetase